MSDQIFALIVRSIPEAFLITTFMYITIKSKVNIKNAIFMAIVGAVFSKAVHYLPIGFGVNTVLGMLVFVFMFKYFTNTKVITSIIATTSAFVGLLLSDTLWGVILHFGFKIPMGELSILTPRIVLLSLGSLVILIGMQLILKKVLESKSKKLKEE